MTTWRNRVEVSYGALRHNVQVVKAAAQGRALIAVAKADAYGLGLERCARIYTDAGADAIAVAAVGEADRVRRAAPQSRIMLLGSPLPEERRAVVSSGYDVWVSNEDELVEYAALASPGRPHPVHIAVDTGMGRAGFPPDAVLHAVERVRSSPTLRLAGLCSHYPMAADAAFSQDQEAAFAGLLAAIDDWPPDGWCHLANSEGLLLRPALPLPVGNQAVRVGLLLTGVCPVSCGAVSINLQPAVRWLSSVSLVKRLPAGHGISYDRTHILTRDSLVALIPVGYADGYPLALSGKGCVVVNGCRAPILGRVTMDYCLVDCTDCERRPVPGDPVVLMGEQAGIAVSVGELASLAGTIPYDILCGLRGRCEVVGVP